MWQAYLTQGCVNYAFKPYVKNKIITYMIYIFSLPSLDKKTGSHVSKVHLENVLEPTVEPIHKFNLWLGIQSKFLSDKEKFLVIHSSMFNLSAYMIECERSMQSCIF